MKRLVIIPLLLAGAAASISLTPAARGRTDVAALTLSGAEAALFNPAHECSYCHGLHGAADAQLLNNANFEALCMSCHDGSFTGPNGPAPAVEVHTNDLDGKSCCGPFRVTCNQCHEPHSNPINRRGNENLKLVLDSVTAPISGTRRAIVFESRGPDFGGPSLYSFCDDDEDNNGIWDQVCDVCHEDPDLNRHHWDGSGQHHQNGATCTSGNCHAHLTAFSP